MPFEAALTSTRLHTVGMPQLHRDLPRYSWRASPIPGDVVLHRGPACPPEAAYLEPGDSNLFELRGVLVGDACPGLLHDYGDPKRRDDGPDLLYKTSVVRVSADLYRLLEGVHVDGEGVRLYHVDGPLGLLDAPAKAELGTAYITYDEGVWGGVSDYAERPLNLRLLDGYPLASDAYPDPGLLGDPC